MATTQKLKENFLTCSICTEVLNQPRSLTCQHSFCRHCLSQYIQTQTGGKKAGSISCPFCRLPAQVPHPEMPMDEWSDQFPPGLVIRNLVDDFSEGDSDMCTLCKEEGKTTPATVWCPECDASLCDGCLKMHQKIPASRNHAVSSVTSVEGKLKIKNKFVCRNHEGETVKLFCKDHKKPICTLCCSIEHRACQEVVLIQDILPEMKEELLTRQKQFLSKIECISQHVNKREQLIRDITIRATSTKSDIAAAVKKGIDMLKDKEKNLLDAVDMETGTKLGQLKSDNKLAQISLHVYQQQSEAINRAVQSECELDMYDMYAFCQSKSTESEDITPMQEPPEIHFTQNEDLLKDAMDTMIIRFKRCSIDLTKQPVLIDTMGEGLTDTDLRDVEILNVNGTTAVVVTDTGNSVISVYKKRNQTFYSHINVGNYPWSLTKLKGNQVAVAVCGEQKIAIIDVKPDLTLVSYIRTGKEYYGLSCLMSSSIIASSLSPPSVDILDLSGSVLDFVKPFQSNVISGSSPYYVHWSTKDAFLVSDQGSGSVSSLTKTGEVIFTYKPTADRSLQWAAGMVTTTDGDILLADMSANKVIHVTETGQFVRDLLTSAEGLNDPFGLAIDGDQLYVAMRRCVKVYRWS